MPEIMPLQLAQFIKLWFSSFVMWDAQKWSNFKFAEFACPCCNENLYWPEFFNRLQWARDIARTPFKINSGHRCGLQNARVGGAIHSSHLTLAADIQVTDRTRHKILKACKGAGFSGFGYYQNFLHVDLGKPRFWFSGEKAKLKWQL